MNYQKGFFLSGGPRQGNNGLVTKHVCCLWKKFLFGRDSYRVIWTIEFWNLYPNRSIQDGTGIVKTNEITNRTT